MEAKVIIYCGGKSFEEVCVDTALPGVIGTSPLDALAEGPVEVSGHVSVDRKLLLRVNLAYAANASLPFERATKDVQDYLTEVAAQSGDDVRKLYSDVLTLIRQLDIPKKPDFDELIASIKMVAPVEQNDRRIPQRGSIPNPKKYNRNKYRL